MNLYNSHDPTEPDDIESSISEENLEYISTHEDKSSLSEKKRRMIYEVISESYFTKSKLYPEELLQKCKTNFNYPQFVPKEIK